MDGNIVIPVNERKVAWIEINDNLVETRGLIRFMEPNKDCPYWLFEYEDGTKMSATGNVRVVYINKGEIA